ncbi:aspartate kinase [Compostibacter hankyongensis]|uniref:Aspartokinase n=1 Tax=Compostibacter hankyongensis TaxID=1007089 RepID=A0ABP8FQD0_9BACT
MKVFKFGGASLTGIDQIRNVAGIIRPFSGTELVVVVSAIGQTTNELEKVAIHYYRRQRETAARLLQNIKQSHLEIAEALLRDPEHAAIECMRRFFTEAEWRLGEKPYLPFDYYYDQLVSLGELLSSIIVSAYLKDEGIGNEWLDVRSVLRTDATYRDAQVDWPYSSQQMTEKVLPLLRQHGLLLTQGFIGSTAEGHTTTLGREGSDYTAALFTNMLNAESLTIWKDVEGLKNADPKLFADTISIREINYREVIEMAYYGARVIHPKTIKPLQNKKIPLYVKCFLDPELPGTVIHEGDHSRQLPPLIVLKQKQVLLTITSRDFSFITEDKISDIYDIFHGLNIHINLTQNGAISFSCCIEHDGEKIERLIKTLHRDFSVNYHEGLELLTIRHYQPELLESFTAGRTLLLEQRAPQTVQFVLK